MPRVRHDDHQPPPDIARLARHDVDRLTCRQRLELFFHYCQKCGRKQHRWPGDYCTCAKGRDA